MLIANKSYLSHIGTEIMNMKVDTEAVSLDWEMFTGGLGKYTFGWLRFESLHLDSG